MTLTGLHPMTEQLVTDQITGGLGGGSMTHKWEDIKKMRYFDSGATRDDNIDKLDYMGFDSPLVNKRYAQFMHLHRKQADGSMRGSSNWKMGIDKQAYVESLIRHVEDVKLHWDGYSDEAVEASLEDVLCAVLFNAKGLLYELLREKRVAVKAQALVGEASSFQASSGVPHQSQPRLNFEG